MSSEPVVSVRNVSKSYRIYDKPQHRLWQSVWRGRRQFFREFWALKDVSFDVRAGETVGILGRNGSGKSTLLQVICGTLDSTQGDVAVNGRLSALLELGAGFNPDYSGRDNVYLNGTLMGMTHRQVDERFDGIAAFADIGRFIDQPVKTYSSGMYVRLAFATAISVDPDVLIVDEALSVGDIAFQNKCMARIRKMSDAGATILFVTHDLGTSQVICDRTIWLEEGRIREIGDPVAVTRRYYVNSLGDSSTQSEQEAVPQQDTGMAYFERVGVGDQTCSSTPTVKIGEPINIRFSLKALSDIEPSVMAISVYRNDGDWLVGQSSREANVCWPACRAGEMLEGEVVFNDVRLAPGEYRIALAAYSFDLTLCYALTGLLTGFEVTSSQPTWGKVVEDLQWRTQ